MLVLVDTRVDIHNRTTTTTRQKVNKNTICGNDPLAGRKILHHRRLSHLHKGKTYYQVLTSPSQRLVSSTN